MTTKTVDRHDMAHAAPLGDLIVSDIIRVNETGVWFLTQHLVEAPLVHADR